VEQRLAPFRRTVATTVRIPVHGREGKRERVPFSQPTNTDPVQSPVQDAGFVTLQGPRAVAGWRRGPARCTAAAARVPTLAGPTGAVGWRAPVWAAHPLARVPARRRQLAGHCSGRGARARPRGPPGERSDNATVWGRAWCHVPLPAPCATRRRPNAPAPRPRRWRCTTGGGPPAALIAQAFCGRRGRRRVPRGGASTPPRGTVGRRPRERVSPPPCRRQGGCGGKASRRPTSPSLPQLRALNLVC